MSDSEITIQYAGRNSTKHFCVCGRRCYPDSIWEPIVKVSLYKNTAGSQTWEYHLSCVKRILAGEEIEDTSCEEHASLRVHLTESNQRTCLLTKKKIREGQKCVTLTYSRLRSFSVEYEAFLSKLSENPIPVRCSKEFIILEHILRSNEISKQIVLEKFKERNGNHEIIDEENFNKLYKRITKQVVEIENVISTMEPLVLNETWPENNRLLFLETNYKIKTEKLRNWIEQIVKRSGYEYTVHHRLEVSKRVPMLGISKVLERYLELHSEVGFVLSPAIWKLPLYEEIQDIKLDLASAFLRPLLKFLKSKNCNEPLDEGALAEGLSSDVQLIRDLCLQIHQKRCNSNTHP